MITVDIPGKRVYQFEYLLLDLNGTLALDGELIDGVRERLALLRGKLEILIVTADTHGNAQSLADGLGVQIHKISAGNEALQKLELVRKLGAEKIASVGAGANDALMLNESGLGICVVGPEGAASETIVAADVVVTDINAALDLLIKPKRLIATLRK